jgi:GntR family transcriptional regulator
VTGKSKYYEVKEQIEAMIHRGEFPVGSQLPSEPELAETFNVSRGTIRQALGELARDAIVARRSGSGTFVIRKPTKKAQLVSFRKQVRAAGMVPTTRILAKEQIMASEAEGRVCEAFFIEPEHAADTPVYRIDRLRCGDDRPLARQTIYLLAADFKPDLLETEDLTQSVFTIYARHHRRVAWADEIIQARPATPEEVDLLEMQDLPPEGRFVYVRDRVSYDQENMPLEVLISIDRGDFFHGYRYRVVEDEHRLGTGSEDVRT